MIKTGLEKIFGTPSVQSILEFLSVYDTVTIKDLQKFTGYSSRTIYDNLKTLIDKDIVEKKERGTYGLTNLRSVQLLAKSYEQILIEFIGKILVQITEKIDKAKAYKEIEPDLNQLEKLSILLEPIFKKYFPSAIQDIVLSVQRLG